MENGEHGTGKHGEFIPNCPIRLRFSPISYQLHTFFSISQNAFLAISHNSRFSSTFLHFPPFPPCFPFSRHFSIFSIFLRLYGYLADSAAANADACSSGCFEWGSGLFGGKKKSEKCTFWVPNERRASATLVHPPPPTAPHSPFHIYPNLHYLSWCLPSPPKLSVIECATRGACGIPPAAGVGPRMRCIPVAPPPPLHSHCHRQTRILPTNSPSHPRRRCSASTPRPPSPRPRASVKGTPTTRKCPNRRPTRTR